MTVAYQPQQSTEKPSPLDFDSTGNLEGTHGLHPFAARFPPALARWAIERFSRPGDQLLDPMMGSGTSLVEFALAGRRGIGIDIDPLARLIGSAKSTPIATSLLMPAIRDLREALADAEDDGWRPELPNFTKWFREDVSSDLAKLRVAIHSLSCDARIHPFLWTVFSSLIVARTSVANAMDLVHSRHHYREWTKNPNTLDRFEKKLRRAVSMMEAFSSALPRGLPHSAEVLASDARTTGLDGGSIDLVVTSPPYCSALDYTRAHMFSVAWLSDVLETPSDEYRDLGREYIGTERAPLRDAGSDPPPDSQFPGVASVLAELSDDRKRSWIVHRYFDDMARVLGEASRVLRSGGHMVCVVCPSNIRRVRVPTHTLLAEMAPVISEGALTQVEMHERTISDRRRVMPYIEASFGPRMRTEYVLVLRRS